jgi:hypothetical protein
VQPRLRDPLLLVKQNGYLAVPLDAGHRLNRDFLATINSSRHHDVSSDFDQSYLINS